MTKEELERHVKRLLWNIANQREKVNGNLNTLINELYIDYSVDAKTEIKRRILENIK